MSPSTATLGKETQVQRDKTGKNQESNQLGINQQNAGVTQGAGTFQLGKGTTDVAQLEAQPGYSPADLAAMKGERTAMLEGTYGGMQEGIARHAAQTGYANDAGLAAQEQTMNRDRL